MLQLKILFRNAFHNKLRSGLTILGITVAVLAFGLLRTVIGAWYAGFEAASASRLVTRNAISIIFPLPITYAEKIRQIAGVKGVSYGNWFGGIYIDEKNFFPNFCVEPRTYMAIYPEFILSPPEKKAFLIIMAVVANTMAMTTRERIGDYAIMKTLGFGGTDIAIMIFGESLVIALTGSFAGMILTFPAAKAFGQTLSTYFPIFIVSAQTLWLDLLAALLIAFFAAIIPARRAIRVGIAEGLRRIG
ncbi:MAG: FtsX-like permease family protein [Proteobacteria bacterium]|nr:FtsX-like permease family protein [Pseudomonadota bacterium]